MAERVVDFRSDTITQPTDEMRDAMRDAPVGDDVYGEDPTVNELQALASKMTGKEAALFVPSGTMANEIAIGVHCPRSTEILVENESHIVLYETAGPASLWGVQIRTLEGTRGVFTARQVTDALRDPSDVHEPRTSMVGIENTHNLAGGTVWTPAQTAAVAKAARERGLKVHVDGARLFNSAVAQDVPAARLVQDVDSVMFALSKGLSAPVGSVLCGTREFIDESTRVRKLLGGGMRQAGILAAAGLVSLTKMVDRLAEDHANARRLAVGLSKLPGFRLDLEAVQTNILFVDVSETGRNARDLVGAWTREGVRASAVDARRIRFVTHRHVTRDDVDWTLSRLGGRAAGAPKARVVAGRSRRQG
jgi:threonine aldolase